MTSGIDDKLIRDIGKTLARNELLRLTLPDGSRLHIDRQLPFLCVYRRPKQAQDAGTERLLLGEAAYLLATSSAPPHLDLMRLVEEIAQRQIKYFGAFLLFELWSAQYSADDSAPLFRIVAPGHKAPQAVLEELETALLAIDIEGHTTRVELNYHDNIHPPGLKPLVAAGMKKVITIGLEINPIYRDIETGELFPFKLRELHHALARALKRSFYTFVHSHTSQRPLHFHELGRHTMTRVVNETDERLAAISQSFDLLLHVTPVNASQAWGQFHRTGFDQLPDFLYRPRPIDPALMKRELFSVPIEKIEDPTLAYIYEQKQIELDRQITLVSDRNTPRFLHGSRQLFGDIEPELLDMAENILRQIPPHLGDDHNTEFVNAEDFAEIARYEVEFYRTQNSKFRSRVEVRDDITGILVSNGNLLIGHDVKVSRLRVEATLAHEIGTHVVTYYNGQQQPLCEFYTGMAGYESLQEGIAVLAEYLVGGLTRPRLRLLAGRVIAVQAIYQGADFIETFRVLHDQYGFSQTTAFNVAMRTYRSGGYTKDLVYLRGFMNLLSYLAGDGDLEMLFLGKISHEQLAFVEELRWRKVLTPATLRPRYLDRPETQQKISKLREGISILDLVSEQT